MVAKVNDESDYRPKFLEKFAFGMGDFWTSIAYNAMATYLTMFYTDVVGIKAATAAIILLSVRFIIAVWDIIVGILVDRTHTKFGKARPWVLFGGIAFGISFILLFTNPFGDGKLALIYAFGIYFIVNFFYSAVNIPYGSMNSLITSNSDERTKLNIFRMTTANVASMLLSIIGMPIINLFPAGSATGWFVLFGTIGVLIPFGYYFTFKFTKERVKPVIKQSENTPHVSVKRQFNALFKNKYWWLTTAFGLVNWLYNGVANGMNAYIAKYVLNDSNLLSLLGVATVLPVAVGLPFSEPIVRKLGKRNATVAGLILVIPGSLLMLINPYSKTLMIISILIRMIGTIPMTAATNPMLTDVIDYGEWRFGLRTDGLVFSANSFSMKIGMGLSSAMVAWILAFSNYDGTLAKQSAQTVSTIVNAFIWIPIVVVVIMIVLMLFYDLDKKAPKIRSELKNMSNTH
ncbi:MFS transporter [Lacticaseibacillus porcinae]|uniref:MFS transporter n=1 Tax=Lacticaseibacillus porcinae TaxID=1123687 RepID=UPI000F795179|nr:MFS transporter [Lacticaseibacillus porcinae]